MSASPTPPMSSTINDALPRLLLVEDEAALRGALVRMLDDWFDVTPLADGTSAAELLNQQRFDVVLSDIHLHDMNGIELLRRVRSADLDVPVILMTGLPDVDGAIAAMELGALTYIKKPFEPRVLDAALARATKLAALARAKRDAIAAGLGGSPVSNERAALTASFERALESMWIAFQPIVDGRSRRTIGFEALMRSSEGTLPTPGAILDAAERLEPKSTTSDATFAGGRQRHSKVRPPTHSCCKPPPGGPSRRRPFRLESSAYPDCASLSVSELTERAAINDVSSNT